MEYKLGNDLNAAMEWNIKLGVLQRLPWNGISNCEWSKGCPGMEYKPGNDLKVTLEWNINLGKI